ncbi:MAG: hypothetical protein WAX04_04890 [Oscillospiraceae bacterium]
MTILTSDYLNLGNCVIRFADCPNDITEIETFVGFTDEMNCEIIFKFHESLLETYCGITHSFSMFDPHLASQYKNPYEIRAICTEMLHWAQVIMRCNPRVLDKHLDIYSKTKIAKTVNAEQLRLDMIETIMHLVNNLSVIAANQHVLVIDGI